MALIFNGTTIPSNVANALIYNGTSITKVVFNSTIVWAQSSFQAKWSGSSTSSDSYGYFTISTSGNLFRYVNRYHAGAWITTNMDGTFTGNSLWGNGVGFITSGNLLRFRYYYGFEGDEIINWCTYTIANKQWIGKSWHHYYIYIKKEYDIILQMLETSGGLIRANTGGSGGPWLSLT